MLRARTKAKSFRITEKCLEALQEEAQRQSISVNTLVNQILTGYTEFGRFMRRSNGMTLTRQTLAQIINAASVDGLVAAAKLTGKSAPPSLIIPRNGTVTVDSVLQLIQNLSTYANLFQYDATDEPNHKTITLVHEMGGKWSNFLANYFGEAFSLAGTQASCTFTDRSVTFTL
jgi:hypothetical protein